MSSWPPTASPAKATSIQRRGCDTGPGAGPPAKGRNRFQLNVNQPVGSGGISASTAFAATTGEARGQQLPTRLQPGFDWGSLTLSASHSPGGRGRRSILLSLSIPIGDKLGAPAPLKQHPLLSGGAQTNARLDLNGGSQDSPLLLPGLYGSHGPGREGSTQGYGANLRYQTASAQLGLSTSQRRVCPVCGLCQGTLLVHV